MYFDDYAQLLSTVHICRSKILKSKVTLLSGPESTERQGEFAGTSKHRWCAFSNVEKYPGQPPTPVYKMHPLRPWHFADEGDTLREDSEALP